MDGWRTLALYMLPLGLLAAAHIFLIAMRVTTIFITRRQPDAETKLYEIAILVLTVYGVMSMTDPGGTGLNPLSVGCAIVTIVGILNRFMDYVSVVIDRKIEGAVNQIKKALPSTRNGD